MIPMTVADLWECKCRKNKRANKMETGFTVQHPGVTNGRCNKKQIRKK